MSGHIVFVRFFLDFPEDFPFDRVAHLKDSEIEAAIVAIEAELSKTATSSNSQTPRQFSVAEWNEGALAKPNSRPLAVAVWKTDKAPPQPPASVTWDPEETLHRCPVAKYNTKEVADTVAASLQKISAELARTALAKMQLSDEDCFFATANPRFFVIAEAELASDERFTFQERIDRLTDADAGIVIVEENFLRGYLPHIKRTLEAGRQSEIEQGVQEGAGAIDVAAQIKVVDDEWWPDMLSSAEIATKLAPRGPTKAAVDAELRRYRKDHPDCAEENEGRRKNETRYLFRTAEVIPHLKSHFNI